MGNDGLTTKEAAEALSAHGRNEMPTQRTSLARKVARWALTPISLMLVAASVLSFALGKRFDGGFILFLLAMNAAVGLWQEGKADRAIAKLNERLATRVRALRDGSWVEVDSREVVPGDVLRIDVGEVVVADGETVGARNLSINESVLTGESFPKQKADGDPLYSGSFVATGSARMRVTATGKGTYFGKVLFSIERSARRSLLEQDILRVSRFLSTLAAGAVVVLSAALLLRRAPVAELLQLDLSLVIAGIPISMPTVMTLIIEIGVIELSKRDVIVRRLSALQDLSNVDLLLTDKTGTMTQNAIVVQDVVRYDGPAAPELLKLAAATALTDERSVINRAVLARAAAEGVDVAGIRLGDFTPADSARKRATATIEEGDGRARTAAVGAPQVIAALCGDGAAARVASDAAAFAAKGYRTLAVAVAEGREEKHMTLVGLLTLADALREDAPDVVAFLRANGVATKLITGDGAAIASEVARQLGLPGERVLTPRDVPGGDWDSLSSDDLAGVRAFAEILPDDKARIVRSAARFRVVAAAGDGVNDLPSLREAAVGIAVKNAVDALRASADIVLLSDGIAVIKDAITESRRIFGRVYTYSIYRLSESFRLILTILLLGLVAGQYPLTAVQLILLALLNDIPIISLAYDRVHLVGRAARIPVRERFMLSSLFGAVGVLNSMLFYAIAVSWLRLPMPVIQTMFFLKLTVGGHLLIYVSRTRERWYRSLPSTTVMVATTATQLVATVLALTGTLMAAPVPPAIVAFTWVWAFFWMQVSELMKAVRARIEGIAH